MDWVSLGYSLCRGSDECPSPAIAPTYSGTCGTGAFRAFYSASDSLAVVKLHLAVSGQGMLGVVVSQQPQIGDCGIILRTPL